MKKNINDKKYECYVEKTKNEEITMDIKEKDEKLKQLSKKTVDFIPKDVFKVQNKNYDFITEGRTFKLNVESKEILFFKKTAQLKLFNVRGERHVIGTQEQYFELNIFVNM